MLRAVEKTSSESLEWDCIAHWTGFVFSMAALLWNGSWANIRVKEIKASMEGRLADECQKEAAICFGSSNMHTYTLLALWRCYKIPINVGHGILLILNRTGAEALSRHLACGSNV